MGRGDRRGVQGSHAPGCSATNMRARPDGRKGQRDSMGSRREATQLGPISRVGQPPPRGGSHGMATMAGRPRDQPYFVARGVGTGRKRMTKPLGEAGPWVV